MSGIAVAGNLVVDHIKTIERLPERSHLVKILSCVDSTGGCVCNTGVDVALLDPSVRVAAYGAVGTDAGGELALDALRARGVDVSGVLRRGVTSFTDVFAERETACRTFFQYGGADDDFDADDVDVDALDAEVFHIGYLLLLKRLDSPDEEHGTRMARLLKRVRERGILTSIDMVSVGGADYARVAPPALKHTDLAIINELEAGETTGVRLVDERGGLLRGNVPLALERLMELGVSRWAIIHTAGGAYGMGQDGRTAFEPSRRLPPGFLMGTVGAGDAFCAGALLAARRGEPLAQALRWGNAAATASLRHQTATGGLCPLDEALALYDQMEPHDPISQ